MLPSATLTSTRLPQSTRCGLCASSVTCCCCCRWWHCMMCFCFESRTALTLFCFDFRHHIWPPPDRHTDTDTQTQTHRHRHTDTDTHRHTHAFCVQSQPPLEDAPPPLHRRVADIACQAIPITDQASSQTTWCVQQSGIAVKGQGKSVGKRFCNAHLAFAHSTALLTARVCMYMCVCVFSFLQ